jgi:hypothetical protein
MLDYIVSYALRLRLIPLVLLAIGLTHSWAQETIVSGKVTDANSGDPIPFVNVVIYTMRI